MDNLSNKPIRKQSLRLEGFDYSSEGGYFVTIVARGRANLFGEIVSGELRLSPLGEIVNDCWYAIPRHFPEVELGAFVVMPNHVHGIIMIIVGARHSSQESKRPLIKQGYYLSQLLYSHKGLLN